MYLTNLRRLWNDWSMRSFYLVLILLGVEFFQLLLAFILSFQNSMYHTDKEKYRQGKILNGLRPF